MHITTHALLSYLLLITSARAQVSAPNCTESTFAWSFNSLQQNPCWVSAYLAAMCNNGSFVVPPLLPQHSYSGPSASDIDKDNLCKCNTVVYNLISACDACQGESWIPYSFWSFNCTTNATAGTFPRPVPAVTRVPKWAYIDTSIGNFWNVSAARLIGDSPEVTGNASFVPTSTSKAQSAVTTGTSSSSTPTSHHSLSTSAIVGGTVGGVIGAALIAGIVLWFSIRRRRARSAPYMDFQGGEKERSPSHPLPIGTLKIYDPSDPMTYPSKEYLPSSNPLFASTSHPQPNECGYSGLPEI